VVTTYIDDDFLALLKNMYYLQETRSRLVTASGQRAFN
jgi:hypothetical protein